MLCSRRRREVRGGAIGGRKGVEGESFGRSWGSRVAGVSGERRLSENARGNSVGDQMAMGRNMEALKQPVSVGEVVVKTAWAGLLGNPSRTRFTHGRCKLGR